MPEMAHTGEYHGNIMFIGCLDDFFVAHGTARLDHATGSGAGEYVKAVPEREKRV